MATVPTKIGIIGAGTISGIYLQNAQRFAALEVVAVADTRPDGAQARAAEYGVPKGCSVEELLADPEVELVVNLTPHRAHGLVGLAVLEAGKHVYNEKPLTVHREEGRRMLALAEEKGCESAVRRIPSSGEPGRPRADSSTRARSASRSARSPICWVAARPVPRGGARRDIPAFM